MGIVFQILNQGVVIAQKMQRAPISHVLYGTLQYLSQPNPVKLLQMIRIWLFFSAFEVLEDGLNEHKERIDVEAALLVV